MLQSHSVDVRAARPIIGASLLTTLFRSMTRIRTTEETIAELLDKNEIRCPTHLCTGQEAIAAGVCAALQKDDYIFGGHRSHGHYLAKGGDLRALMAELYGKATGCSRGRGGSLHLIAQEVGLLGTVPRVSVAFFGDGATEEGHVHEAVNFAGLQRLPVIFVCENNLYSSHMHIRERRVKDNIFQAGDAHGIPGLRVDGNDAGVVYRTALDAVRRARSGRGPTLIECRTYRWRGHVGSSMDFDVGVKRKDELREWLSKDPVARARAALLEQGLHERALEEIESEVRAEIEDAVQFARDSAYPHGDELLEHVFFLEKS